MSLVSHLRRVKCLPKSMSRLGIWLTLFSVFLLGKGRPSYADNASRIIGGKDAPEGRYPYMCSLRETADGSHECGGFLIDENWIMTAAHCLESKEPELNPIGLSPYAFCNITLSDNPPPFKRFKTNCQLHHMWDGHISNGSDIALCELDKSTGLSIPKLASSDQSFTEDSVFNAIGWGKTSPNSGVADTLQIGKNLEHVSNCECNAGRKLSTTIIESMLCSGDGKTDTCAGDSGGPLFIPYKSSNEAVSEDPELDLIVGITSFGSENCQGAPGVYTRISCYRQWIDCVIQGKGPDCNVRSPCQEETDPSSGVSSSAFDKADALNRIERALQSDDSESVKEILCQGLSPNAVFSDFRNSLLIIAAQHDAVKSAQVLLEQGANLEYENSFGQTALSRAARYGSARVAQIFIDNEVNVESTDDIGWTALHYVARYNHLQIAQILIDSEAKVASKTDTGSTPLHIAATYNSLAVAKELIAAGANLSSRTNKGFTPLHLAAIRNTLEVARELLSNGARRDARTNVGGTPLHLSSYHGSLDVVQLLLDEQAKVDLTNDRRKTPLHQASSRGHPSVVRVLLLNGASKTSIDEDGKTPLDVICTNQFLEKPCTDHVINEIRRLFEP